MSQLLKPKTQKKYHSGAKPFQQEHKKKQCLGIILVLYQGKKVVLINFLSNKFI